MVIFRNFLTTSSHLHPLQVENCDSNSRLVVDEDDNGKVRLERVKGQIKNVKTAVDVISTLTPKALKYLHINYGN